MREAREDYRCHERLNIILILLFNRISEIEDKIGAGLIEEVIEVAEGELALVDTMIESKA